MPLLVLLELRGNCQLSLRVAGPDLHPAGQERGKLSRVLSDGASAESWSMSARAKSTSGNSFLELVRLVAGGVGVMPPEKVARVSGTKFVCLCTVGWARVLEDTSSTYSGAVGSGRKKPCEIKQVTPDKTGGGTNSNYC